MAECHSKKTTTTPPGANSGFDLYGGIMFNGKRVGTTGTGKIDRFQGWSSYNNDDGQGSVAAGETRISNYPKEDSFTYSSIYTSDGGFRKENSPPQQQETTHKSDSTARVVSSSTSGGGSSTTTTGAGSLRNGSFVNCSSPRRLSGGGCQSESSSIGTRKSAGDGGGSASEDGRRSSNGCGVPPLGNSAAGSSSAKGAGSTTGLNSNDASPPGLPLHCRSSSTEENFRKYTHSRHRRQISDVGGSARADAVFGGGENNFQSSRQNSVSGDLSSSSSSGGGGGGGSSSTAASTPRTTTGCDSSPYWSRSDSDRSSSKGGGGGSGSSSSGGSPTVLSLKVGSSTSADCPSPRAGSSTSSSGSSRGSSLAGSPTVGRSSSVGSLFGNNITSVGASATAESSSIGTAPPTRSISCNAGILRGAGSSGGGLLVSVHGRGNIYAVGESLLIKRMLQSTDPEEVKNAGNDQYKKGNFSEALSLYDRAIYLAPGRASYKSNRAAALTGLGRLAEAVQECEESIKLDASYIRAQQRLVSLCIRLGRVERAKKILKVCGSQLDSGDIQRLEKIEKHLLKCLEAKRALDWNTIVRESEAAVVSGADSAPQILTLKAEALLKLCRPEEADTVIMSAQKVETALRKATGMPPDTNMLIVQANVDMALGRFDDAVTAAEKAFHFDPKNSEVLALLRGARSVALARTTGNDLYKAGRIMEASVAYGQGLLSNPSNAVLLCNRAACRSRLGQYEKAVEDCNAALDAQPHYTKALLRRAHSNYKLERWADALRDYEALKRELPGNVEVARALSEVQLAFKKSLGEESYQMWYGGGVGEISSNDQFRKAVSCSGLAVVLFNTRWSDRCRQMVPVVDKLCKQNRTVKFLQVDVEANPFLAKAESVDFVPTFKIYKDGFKVKELLGPTEEALEHAVSHYSL
ncbi:unnamed protein product [Sphagnum troendelagicum]|uniref:Thioredoxin domain-containing protein n=1 Tax=Sphagnum troendelagicum TaxID=128251 RepID=A0ABP0T9X3_9BRYO